MRWQQLNIVNSEPTSTKKNPKLAQIAVGIVSKLIL